MKTIWTKSSLASETWVEGQGGRGDSTWGVFGKVMF